MRTFFHTGPLGSSSDFVVEPVGPFEAVFALENAITTGPGGAGSSFVLRVEDSKCLDEMSCTQKVQRKVRATGRELGLRLSASEVSSVISGECEPDEKHSDDWERGWELQRVRAVVARELGYQAVSCIDEHGSSWMVLPGVSACRSRASGAGGGAHGAPRGHGQGAMPGHASCTWQNNLKVRGGRTYPTSPYFLGHLNLAED